MQDRKDYLDALMSIHTDISDKLDWSKMAKQARPAAPRPDNTRSARAEALFQGYKPGFVARLFGRGEGRKKVLQDALLQARNEEKRQYESELRAHEKAVKEIELERALAMRVLDGDDAAYQKVLKEYRSAIPVKDFGKDVAFHVENGLVRVNVEVHDDSIIPDDRLKQLTSGKLSSTKMPKAECNEIYQDYVASVSIRMAGEVFQMLPLDWLVVTCKKRMLNSATGHMDISPILSVMFVRETFRTLNLGRIDPSDALANFVHNTSFSRTKGFAVTDEIKAGSGAIRSD